MRILDKYILREFFGPFLFGVAAFTAIFIGSDTLFRIAEYVTKYGASWASVSKLFLLAMPRIIIYTFPMSVLLGSLMCFSRLSGSSELIVMRTSGQSFLRLAAPVFTVAFLISVMAVAFNEYVVPWTNNTYQTVINQEIKQNIKPGTTEHIVLKDMQNGVLKHLLYARRYDPDTHRLENITIQEFTDDGVTRMENAPFAIWKNNSWYMEDGVIYDLTADGVERMMHFDQQMIPYAQNPQEIQKKQKDLDEMTIRELKDQEKAFSAAHADTTEVVMEINKRFSLPLASFVFALVGAPLGIQKQRSSSSIGFGLSVIVIFFYYAVMTFTGALGRGHALPPAAAVWLPDALALAVGMVLSWRVSR